MKEIEGNLVLMKVSNTTYFYSHQKGKGKKKSKINLIIGYKRNKGKIFFHL